MEKRVKKLIESGHFSKEAAEAIAEHVKQNFPSMTIRDSIDNYTEYESDKGAAMSCGGYPTPPFSYYLSERDKELWEERWLKSRGTIIPLSNGRIVFKKFYGNKSESSKTSSSVDNEKYYDFICINSIGLSNITEGKTYSCNILKGDLWFVIDDFGEKVECFKDRFKKA